MRANNLVTSSCLSALLLASSCASLQITQDAAAGRNALQIGKPELAASYLRRAVDADPSYRIPNRLQESGLALLGRAYFEIGDLPEARASLERAIATDNGDFLARLYFGATLIKAGEQERGKREVESGLKAMQEWIDYVASSGYSGQFWDPAREIRSDIMQALGAMLPAPELLIVAQRVGVKLNEESEKALRDEQRHRSGGNS